jgi:hypothetical protein
MPSAGTFDSISQLPPRARHDRVRSRAHGCPHDPRRRTPQAAGGGWATEVSNREGAFAPDPTFAQPAAWAMVPTRRRAGPISSRGRGTSACVVALGRAQGRDAPPCVPTLCARPSPESAMLGRNSASERDASVGVDGPSARNRTDRQRRALSPGTWTRAAAVTSTVLALTPAWVLGSNPPASTPDDVGGPLRACQQNGGWKSGSNADPVVS